MFPSFPAKADVQKEKKYNALLDARETIAGRRFVDIHSNWSTMSIVYHQIDSLFYIAQPALFFEILPTIKGCPLQSAE